MSCRDRAWLWGLVVLATSIVLFPSIAQGAESWREVHRLIANDANLSDTFGIAVDLDGSLAVIGAELDGERGTDAGAAYLFDATSGGQRRKLTADDAEQGDQFGCAVAIHATRIVVGALGDDDHGSRSGSAYVFDAVSGQQQFKLTPDDATGADLFGEAVALFDSRAVIGARGHDGAEVNMGAAYILDVTTGEELHQLTAADPQPDHFFGHAVDIDGSYAIVGAMFDADLGEDAGAAYVFDVASGQQLRKLTASDGAAGDRFGEDVAVSGNLAIVGAPLKAGGGAAYVFDLTTGNELFILLASDRETNDRLGEGVDIHEHLVAVGAPYDNDNGASSGAVYFFDATTGEELDKVIASDGSEFDTFGEAVAIEPDCVLIGAPLSDVGFEFEAGAAYVFERVVPRLRVSPSPIRAGQNAQFLVRNATPDENTYLAYSTKGLGSTYVGFLNVTLDLRRPKQAGNKKKTDALGDVTWSLPIDESYDGLDVWLQAAQFENKTNVVATSIIGDASCDEPVLLHKLKASDPSQTAYFGNHVALHHGMLAVGSRTDDDNGVNSGSAYLFDVSTGTEIRKLLPPDGDSYDQFGFAVAVNDEYVLVGSPEHGIGAVYVFDLNSGTLVYKLVPIDSSGSALFGHSVAVHGDIAVVGAPATLDHNVPGAAYVFDLTDGDELAKLVADDGAPGDFFGWSVALDDFRIVVGAQGADVGGEGSGAAYLFGHGDPNQLGKIAPSDPAAFDHFGRAVAVDGGFVLVSAPFDDNSNGTNAGAVYLFNAFNGNELAKFLASDGANNAKFGNAIAYDADSQLATVCTDNVSAGLRAYAFDMTTGEELFVTHNTTNGFGDAVTLEGTTMVVGAWGDDEVEGDSGAAFMYCICCQ